MTTTGVLTAAAPLQNASGGPESSTTAPPAPTQPAPTQPAPTQPAPTQPAPTQPAPATPTATPVAAATAPVVETTPIRIATPIPLSSMERWRMQQQNREVFPTLRNYTTNGTELWWYDPVNQQHVILGTISGSFAAQAQFTLTSSNAPALEVPYQVNEMYGLTSISPAFVQRISEAGYSGWIETYVINDERVQSRQNS